MYRFNYPIVHSPARSVGAWRLVCLPLLILPNRKLLLLHHKVGQESVEQEVTSLSEKLTSQEAGPGVRMYLEIIQSLKLALPGAKLVSPDVEFYGLNAESKNARKSTGQRETECVRYANTPLLHARHSAHLRHFRFFRKSSPTTRPRGDGALCENRSPSPRLFKVLQVVRKRNREEGKSESK